MVSFPGCAVSRRARQKPCSPQRLTHFFKVTAAVCHCWKNSGAHTHFQSKANTSLGKEQTHNHPATRACMLKPGECCCHQWPAIRAAQEAILTSQALAPLLGAEEGKKTQAPVCGCAIQPTQGSHMPGRKTRQGWKEHVVWVTCLSLRQGFSYHTSTVLGWNSDPSGHFPWAQGYQDPAMHWVTWSKLKPSLTMAVSHPIHVCSFPSPTHITCTDIQPCLSASHTLSSQFIQQRARWVMPGAPLSTIYACTSLDLTIWGRHCYRFIVQWGGEQGGQIRLKNCWSVAFYQNVSIAFQLCICSLSKELATRMSLS